MASQTAITVRRRLRCALGRKWWVIFAGVAPQPLWSSW
jgi:hypothetical protein